MPDNEQRYKETLEFLYNRLQAFHRVGATAYKPGLHTTFALSAAFGNPHSVLRTIHVAGTNGKGSTAHTLASVLTAAGYRTGLYTSPHLLDFNERIRVDGHPISHDEVLDFTDRFRALPSFADGTLDPSFFELATVMAFEHFARHKVDVAVIEVGLGGRLDSTNIITPDVSVVTNISMDHMALLGDTLEAIAAEKAGIFKEGVPAVIGETVPETYPVFVSKAAEAGAPLIFAEETPAFSSYDKSSDAIIYHTDEWGDIAAELTGDCQVYNANTILHVLSVLRGKGYLITPKAVREGFGHVVELTGLMGRWMEVCEGPLTILDTGHNPGAWQYLGPRLNKISENLALKGAELHIVLGFVSDKDISHIIDYLPSNARYTFVQPDTPRAAAASDVAAAAAQHNIHGAHHPSVAEGIEAARQKLSAEDVLFVGGSNFVVSEALPVLRHWPNYQHNTTNNNTGRRDD